MITGYDLMLKIEEKKIVLDKSIIKNRSKQNEKKHRDFRERA